MTRRKIPDRGDIYWINPNPVSGHEIKDNHRFVILTRKEINKLGICITVPITNGAKFARENGLTVSILGHDTTGVAVCNQVRSFDIDARVKSGNARFVERLDDDIIDEIINRVTSVIDPQL